MGGWGHSCSLLPPEVGFLQGLRFLLLILAHLMHHYFDPTSTQEQGSLCFIAMQQRALPPQGAPCCASCILMHVALMQPRGVMHRTCSLCDHVPCFSSQPR